MPEKLERLIEVHFLVLVRNTKVRQQQTHISPLAIYISGVLLSSFLITPISDLLLLP